MMHWHFGKKEMYSLSSSAIHHHQLHLIFSLSSRVCLCVFFDICNFVSSIISRLFKAEFQNKICKFVHGQFKNRWTWLIISTFKRYVCVYYSSDKLIMFCLNFYAQMVFIFDSVPHSCALQIFLSTMKRHVYISNISMAVCNITNHLSFVWLWNSDLCLLY